MIDSFCPSCGCRVLVTPRQMIEMTTDELGIKVTWRCTCGALGTETTGRPSARRPRTRSIATRGAGGPEAA